MYGDDDEQFATMGDQQFATVGYDDGYGQPQVGQLLVRPGLATRAAPGRQVQVAPGMLARAPAMMAPAMRAPVQQMMATQAMTENRVRAIVEQELNARLPAWFQGASKVPGSSDQSQLMSPLGLGVGTLTNAVNSVVLTAAPQRPFRGERLIVDLARSAGAATVPVRISEFKIGENSQLVGSGALPAEAFDPAAFGVRLMMSPSAPGIVVLLRVETDVGAVPAGESISVTSAIIGRALWGESCGPG